MSTPRNKMDYLLKDVARIERCLPILARPRVPTESCIDCSLLPDLVLDKECWCRDGCLTLLTNQAVNEATNEDPRRAKRAEGVQMVPMDEYPKQYLELLEERFGNRKDEFSHSFDYILDAVNRGHRIADQIEKFTGPLGANCLDVGCLDGGVSIAFAMRGCDVIGIDLDEDCIQRARILNEHFGTACAFIKEDILDSAFSDGQFDLIIANDVIEHVDSQDAFAREMSRLLGPGGILYISAPNRFSPAIIKSDPHFRVIGLSLLPRKIAQFYIERIRKKINPLYGKYHLGYYPTYFSVKKLFRNNSIELSELNDAGSGLKALNHKLLSYMFTFIGVKK